MKEQLISFETAKLAKEKGFNIETCDFYSEGVISNLVPQGDYKYLSVNYDNIGEDISPHGMWKWNSTNDSKRLITAFNECYEEDFKEVFSAPTQSLLQKWLREVHNIEVFAKSEYKNTIKIGFYYGGDLEYSKPIYKTYEEALEKGLQKGLKLIKK